MKIERQDVFYHILHKLTPSELIALSLLSLPSRRRGNGSSAALNILWQVRKERSVCFPSEETAKR